MGGKDYWVLSPEREGGPQRGFQALPAGKNKKMPVPGDGQYQGIEMKFFQQGFDEREPVRAGGDKIEEAFIGGIEQGLTPNIKEAHALLNILLKRPASIARNRLYRPFFCPYLTEKSFAASDRE
jgi:hypothetical protein